jgi:hypothetical protein
MAKAIKNATVYQNGAAIAITQICVTLALRPALIEAAP